MKSEIIRTLKEATIDVNEMLNTAFCEVESDRVYIICDKMDLNSEEQGIELWIDDVQCFDVKYLELIANHIYEEAIANIESPIAAFTDEDRQNQLKLIFE